MTDPSLEKPAIVRKILCKIVRLPSILAVSGCATITVDERNQIRDEIDTAASLIVDDQH
jgi:hypothetical protein